VTAKPAVLPTIRFRLPGDWWMIPLADRDAAVASAARLIRLRIGPQDDRATVRARLARDFSAAIDEAIAGSGQSMLIAIQIVESVPLPITITVYLPDVAMAPSIGTAGGRVLDILQQGLEGLSNEQIGDLGELTRLELAGTVALRSERIRSMEVGSGDDGGTLDVLLVDYWLAIPGTKRVLLANFSTPFVELREYLLVFFDAIVRAAYWEQPQ
jgi:hypothetical protein